MRRHLHRPRRRRHHLAAGADAGARDRPRAGRPSHDRSRHKDRDKRNIPRDKDGKPSKWVEGMAFCRCGVNGGKHLFKDCPKKKEKEARDKKALAATREALAASDASASKGTGPTDDQLRTLLSALFTASVPTVNLASADGATGE